MGIPRRLFRDRCSGRFPSPEPTFPHRVVMFRKPFNPFYVLVVLVGVAFCLTAFAYGVMTVRGLHGVTGSETSPAGKALMEWMDTRGFSLMMIEIGLLGVLTFAAIATDEYWDRPSPKKGSAPPTNDATAGPGASGAQTSAAPNDSLRWAVSHGAT